MSPRKAALVLALAAAAFGLVAAILGPSRATVKPAPAPARPEDADWDVWDRGHGGELELEDLPPSYAPPGWYEGLPLFGAGVENDRLWQLSRQFDGN